MSDKNSSTSAAMSTTAKSTSPRVVAPLPKRASRASISLARAASAAALDAQLISMESLTVFESEAASFMRLDKHTQTAERAKKALATAILSCPDPLLASSVEQTFHLFESWCRTMHVAPIPVTGLKVGYFLRSFLSPSVKSEPPKPTRRSSSASMVGNSTPQNVNFNSACIASLCRWLGDLQNCCAATHKILFPSSQQMTEDLACSGAVRVVIEEARRREAVDLLEMIRGPIVNSPVTLHHSIHDIVPSVFSPAVVGVRPVGMCYRRTSDGATVVPNIPSTTHPAKRHQGRLPSISDILNGMPPLNFYSSTSNIIQEPLTPAIPRLGPLTSFVFPPLPRATTPSTTREREKAHSEPGHLPINLTEELRTRTSLPTLPQRPNSSLEQAPNEHPVAPSMNPTIRSDSPDSMELPPSLSNLLNPK
ncbi:hypothetical protein T439DRAFT_360179 [Meredithblackwellia eburnea MCA 4105]